jgi:hypothetical protein
MENVLEIVEQTLINLARKYQTFTEQEDLKYVDIKDYDTELNDIMERYKTLKSLQSVISVEDLQILYNEYNTIFQDFKSKYESGYFIGKDGLNGTFEDLTQEQKDSLKGEKGDKGEDGLNGTFEDLTQEQKDSLKGEKGDKGEDGLNGTFEDLTQEQKDSLKGEKGDKGEDGLNGTFEDLTQEQKDSLKGEKGDKGEDGLNGTFEDLTQEQKDTLKGQNGLSAYEIAVNEGFEGTQSEWLKSLEGRTGDTGRGGATGLSAYQIAQNEGYEGTKLEWLESLIGENGLSAYEIAVNEGFEGTQLEWLESLKGSGVGEGGAGLSLPIEIQDVNELGANLTRISQGLGELQGKVGSVNSSQLYGELQGVKGTISSLSNQLNFIVNKLNGVYVYNEETYQDELVEEGLLTKVDKLYAQYTSPVEG